jgi:hypothetical protein
MLREGFDRATVAARATELADLIRDDVYADTNKPYSSSDFETGLVTDLGAGQQVSYGLLPFVEGRAAYLDEILDTYADETDLRLNEVLVVNSGGLYDSAGDRDPWLEIYNLGPGQITPDRVYLSDDPEQPARWRLPEWPVDDGEYLLVWLDGETWQGADHAGFSLQPGGGQLCLYAVRGGQSTEIDCVSYPVLAADEALVRLGDGTGAWTISDRATPGHANLASAAPPAVFVNELMAENDATIPDPDGNGGYPDWFELYNAGDDTVELGGMYLTDDLDDPCKWQIPEGVSIPGRGYLLFWADNDENQGACHAGFKLDADGEVVALFQSDGDSVRLVDSVVFPALAADISFGRAADGAGQLVRFEHPTPGSANSSSPRRPSGRL